MAYASMRCALELDQYHTNVWAIIIRLSSYRLCAFHFRRTLYSYIHTYYFMLRRRYRHRLIGWQQLLRPPCHVPFVRFPSFQRLFNARVKMYERVEGRMRVMVPDSGSWKKHYPWRMWFLIYQFGGQECVAVLIVFSSAPCHMIDTWRQRENAEEWATVKTPDDASRHHSACHTYDTITERTLHSSSPSSRLTLIELISPSPPTNLLSGSSLPTWSNQSQPERTWAPNTFIMVNKAIPVNGNHAVNGGVSDIAITSHGSNWYFVRWRVFSFPASSVALHLWL